MSSMDMIRVSMWILTFIVMALTVSAGIMNWIANTYNLDKILLAQGLSLLTLIFLTIITYFSLKWGYKVLGNLKQVNKAIGFALFGAICFIILAVAIWTDIWTEDISSVISSMLECLSLPFILSLLCIYLIFAWLLVRTQKEIRRNKKLKGDAI